MRLILKNTEGRRDAVYTMAVWAFVVVTVKVLFAGLSISVGSYTWSAGLIDGGVIAALLTPTLGAYCMRRHTDALVRGRMAVELEAAGASSEEAE